MPKTLKKQKIYVVSEAMPDGAPLIHGVFTNANRAAKVQEKHKADGTIVFMSSATLNEEDFVAREMTISADSRAKSSRGFLRCK